MLPVEDALILDESYDVDAKGLKICARVKNVEAGFADGEREPARTPITTATKAIATTIPIDGPLRFLKKDFIKANCPSSLPAFPMITFLVW